MDIQILKNLFLKLAIDRHGWNQNLNSSEIACIFNFFNTGEEDTGWIPAKNIDDIPQEGKFWFTQTRRFGVIEGHLETYAFTAKWISDERIFRGGYWKLEDGEPFNFSKGVIAYRPFVESEPEPKPWNPRKED